MMHSTDNEQKTLAVFDLLTIALSIYVMVALIIDTFVPINPEVSRMLNIIDNIVCFIFLYDFAKDFYKAKSKWQFMKWGWIDLLASIPYLDFFRAGRILRLFRLLRLLRAFRSIKLLMDHVFHKKTKGAFTTALMVAVMMLIFSSIAILTVETDPQSNIKNAEDALWWAFVTLTTTGYGDRYPVTTEGRLIAAVLMVVGVGLFGTFTGYVASWFVQDEGKKEQVNE
jgi:voltage-gated potassium channel